MPAHKKAPAKKKAPKPDELARWRSHKAQTDKHSAHADLIAARLRTQGKEIENQWEPANAKIVSKHAANVGATAAVPVKLKKGSK